MNRAITLAAWAVAGFAAGLAQAADALTDGVNSIAGPGLPGVVAVWGESAAIAITGPADGGTRQGVVATATYGKGRVVAMAHTGYLSSEQLAKGDTRRLMSNAVTWLAPGKQKPRVAAVEAAEFVKQELGGVAVDWSQLQTVDVLILRASEVPEDKIDAVREFVHGGGGLLVVETGWGWQQLNPGKSIVSDDFGNAAIFPMGLGFTTGTTGDDHDGLIDVKQVLAETKGLVALESVERATPENKLTREQSKLASATILACHSIAPADSPFGRKLDAAVKQIGATTRPSPAEPLDESRPLERVAHVIDLRTRMAAKPSDVVAAPQAATFPGTLAADAERVTRVVAVDGTRTKWHSTGLYAGPGEKVTVRPVSAPAAVKLRVRIGCHTDSLEHLAKWPRAVEITKSWNLSGTEPMVVANPFGGPVYVETNKATDQKIEVEIAGAAEAPLFVLGKTSVEEWKKSRAAPAPWAELVVPGRVVLTCRSEHLRSLDDPTPVLEHWGRVLDAMADLAGIAHERPYEERIVTDVEISAGYMHSGYPIMTHLDVGPAMTDLAALKTLKAGWGFYHELGHNHQQPEWTFEGTGEVTNNVYAHYVFETVCGLTKEQATERALGKGNQKEIAKQLGDRDFARWKREPFLALAMYAQLHTSFGWEPFKKVFAEYRDMKPGERPKSEVEKRDEWMVRMSKATGRNLGPFFDSWGVPVSDKAKSEVAGLPRWMP